MKNGPSGKISRFRTFGTRNENSVSAWVKSRHFRRSIHRRFPYHSRSFATLRGSTSDAGRTPSNFRSFAVQRRRIWDRSMARAIHLVAVTEQLAGPSISRLPEWTRWTGLSFWVVLSFLVWASDDAIGGNHRLHFLLPDEGNQFLFNRSIPANVCSLGQPSLQMHHLSGVIQNDSHRDLGGAAISGSIERNRCHRVSAESLAGQFARPRSSLDPWSRHVLAIGQHTPRAEVTHRATRPRTPGTRRAHRWSGRPLRWRARPVQGTVSRSFQPFDCPIDVALGVVEVR